MGSKSLLLPAIACSLLLLLVLPVFLNLPTFLLPFCPMLQEYKREVICNERQPRSDQGKVTQYEKSSAQAEVDPIRATEEDVRWVRAQLDRNRLGEAPKTAAEWYKLRKGINPRSREEQLNDLLRYKGISHYEGIHNHTAFPCPGELLVEQHHSNYGEPWAGGRDVFEFLAGAVNLKPEHQVLEVGCGTLRVGLHFIRYLFPSHYHCVERDPLSLMAAFRYELPSQGLLHKKPVIVRGEDMNFDVFGTNIVYDLIYASAVFLHMQDDLVWTALERLVPRLAFGHGHLFVSHNIKFCTRLPAGVCQERLAKLEIQYVGKHTHDSLLFNHYEIWFEFKRTDGSIT